jgi:hypothetical protein
LRGEILEVRNVIPFPCRTLALDVRRQRAPAHEDGFAHESRHGFGIDDPLID